MYDDYTFHPVQHRLLSGEYVFMDPRRVIRDSYFWSDLECNIQMCDNRSFDILSLEMHDAKFPIFHPPHTDRVFYLTGPSTYVAAETSSGYLGLIPTYVLECANYMRDCADANDFIVKGDTSLTCQDCRIELGNGCVIDLL